MCIEAGGPEPGVGCAGRGILTMFDALKALGVDGRGADITVYDVLGDVVCGGFAVPMRSEHTDAIYIVTSGEFMSIYAANNILRGLLNFGSDPPRVAGFIFNERGSPGERVRVEALSKATGIPIVADVPRAGEFMEAESAGITVSERFPDSSITSIYRSLADDVVDVSQRKRPLHEPKPLTEDQLDDLLAGRPVDEIGQVKRDSSCNGSPLLGMGSCASRGAVFLAGRVTDLPIIVHGPDSCGYVMSHTQESTTFRIWTPICSSFRRCATISSAPGWASTRPSSEGRPIWRGRSAGFSIKAIAWSWSSPPASPV